MKILRLRNNKVAPCVAYCSAQYKSGVNKDKLSFMIQHGNYGEHSWCLRTYLHRDTFPPTKSGDTLVLDKNNYTFKVQRRAIKDKNNKTIESEFTKDNRGNYIYMVDKDEISLYNNNIILFWDIPITTCDDVEYQLEGNVRTLADGEYAKEYLDSVLVVPAPILEIYGDCKLSWSGLDSVRNIKYKQSITYNYNRDEWDSTNIEKINLTDNKADSKE